jgi:hypothetical protein
MRSLKHFQRENYQLLAACCSLKKYHGVAISLGFR